MPGPAARGPGPAAPARRPKSLAGCESVRLFAERAAAGGAGLRRRRARTRRRSRRSPAGWTACRWPSSWPRRGSSCCRRRRSWPGWSTRCGLLTGGGRDLPDRQQTLRATIAWSYDLLTEGARRLLAACSVFAGGASLEVDRDGLRRRGGHRPAGARWPGRSWSTRACCGRCGAPGPARYAMLETIREYAAERLDRMPEADRVRARPCRRVPGPGRGGRPPAAGPGQEGMARAGRRPSTTTSARRIGWYREHDPPAALRLAAAMSAFWSLRGHHTEGRQRLGELLGLVAEPSLARVSALNGAAWLAIDQGDYADAAGLLGESIGLSRALGDTVGEAIATVYLGRCKMSSLDTAAGAPDVERAVALVSRDRGRPGDHARDVLLRHGRAAHRPAGSRLRCVRPLRRDGRRARPDPADRAGPADARLPPAGPGRARRGQDRAGGGGAGIDGDRRPLDRPDRAGRLHRARGQDRAAPAGAPAGRGGRRVPGGERVLHAGAHAGDRRPLARRRPEPRPGGRPGGWSRRAGG